MYNSGVIAVSAQSFDISDDSRSAIPGFMAEIAAAQKTGKAVIITDLENGGKPLSPVPAIVLEGELTGTMVCITAMCTLTVTSADVVTVSGI